MDPALLQSLRDAMTTGDSATWKSEHEILGRTDSPDSKRACLAIRRDLRAVKMPDASFKITDQGIPNHQEFHVSFTRLLKKLEDRCTFHTQGIPLAKLYGPCEGGMGIREEATRTQREQTFDLKMIAWNVRGAFSSGGESNVGNVAKLMDFMHIEGAA